MYSDINRADQIRADAARSRNVLPACQVVPHVPLLCVRGDAGHSLPSAGSTGATAFTGFVVGRLPLSLCFVLAAVPVAVSAAAVLLSAGQAGWRLLIRPSSSLW
ncbi:hypothetical protein GCM10010439_59650 [Actinocorallia aurantiaca]|uniref:Uncharacterized protein n=1 Tax=Actinocorallia aurantiaca TaxID=46204 RepID=A0ABP6H4E3_9ACTN